MYTVLLLLVTSILTLSYSAPLDISNKKIHGFIVEKEITGKKLYPEPDYIAPLIVEGQKGVVHLTADTLPSKGHVGYVPVGCIKGKLMLLEHFKKNYKLPDFVEFKYVDGAQPIYEEENK